MTAAQKKQAARVYNLEQQQRYNERNIRKYKRLEAGQLDAEDKAKYTAKREYWEQRNADFVKANGDVLRRRYENEKTRGITSFTPPTALTETPMPKITNPPVIVEPQDVVPKVAGATGSGKKFGAERGQIEVAKGKVSDADIDSFNKKSLQQIIDETGYSEEQAKQFQADLQEYLGGDYASFTNGEQAERVARIDDGLSKMGTYNGEMYRGMTFANNSVTGAANADYTKFLECEPGSTLEMKSVSSWSSGKEIAERYGSISQTGSNSVLVVCEKNTSAVGVQHISKWGDTEKEVLAPSVAKWEVTTKTTISKYDYYKQTTDVSGLSPFKQRVYNSTLEKLAQDKGTVTIIKVKEV